MKLFHENPIFETVKSKVIISLFETVRLSVSISPRNLYNSLKSIKENYIPHCMHTLYAEDITRVTVHVFCMSSHGLTFV